MYAFQIRNAECLCTPGKCKLRSDVAEVCRCLGELEKAAEECAEERELKRRKLEWEMEDKRQQAQER